MRLSVHQVWFKANDGQPTQSHASSAHESLLSLPQMRRETALALRIGTRSGYLDSRRQDWNLPADLGKQLELALKSPGVCPPRWIFGCLDEYSPVRGIAFLSRQEPTLQRAVRKFFQQTNLRVCILHGLRCTVSSWECIILRSPLLPGKKLDYPGHS